MKTLFSLLLLVLVSSCVKQNTPDVQPRPQQSTKIRGIWFDHRTYQESVALGTETLETQLDDFGFNNIFIDLKGYEFPGEWNEAAKQNIWQKSLDTFQESSIQTNLVYPVYLDPILPANNPAAPIEPLGKYLLRKKSILDQEFLNQDEVLRKHLLALPADRFVLTNLGEYDARFGPDEQEWQAFAQTFPSLVPYNKEDLYRYEVLTREWKRGSLHGQWFGWRFPLIANQNAEFINQTKRLSRGKEVGFSINTLFDRYPEGAVHWSTKLDPNLEAFDTPVQKANSDLILVECLTDVLTIEEAKERGLKEEAALTYRLDTIAALKNSNTKAIAILSPPMFAGDDLILSPEEKQKLLEAMALCENKIDGTLLLDWKFVAINDFQLIR